MKEALVNIAKDTGVILENEPQCKNDWAALAQLLGVKVFHISERDTQIPRVSKRRGEFVNTWSCPGFISEGSQPSELGWGTHEKDLPRDGHHHTFGNNSAIYLARPGISTRVRTWTPLEENFIGFLITHNEAISIADYLSVRDDQGVVVYRPTVHYAYHPCDSAVLSLHELQGKNLKYEDLKMRVMITDIEEGMDELGILLCGHKKNAYWYGSQLTTEQAMKVAPNTSATSLQVCAAVLSSMVWAIENPNEGIVEAEDMDYKRILEIAVPYLGDVVGEYTDWTPLQDRGLLFPEELDLEDCWQFKNIRVD